MPPIDELDYWWSPSSDYSEATCQTIVTYGMQLSTLADMYVA